MGPGEKYTPITKSSSSSNYVAETDGTMTVLSLAWIVEEWNAGLQFPLGTSVPTHPLVLCLPIGVHIIMMCLGI
jgi:hypothetical protein